MKQFMKTDGGLTAIGTVKMRIFDSVEEAELAVANGEVNEGEVIATKYNESGDYTLLLNTLADNVSTIQALIPSDTDTTNTLVNQSMLSDATGTSIEVQCDGTSITTIDPTHPLNLNKVAFDGADDKVSCSDYTQQYQDLVNSMNSEFCCRVQCYDYNTYTAATNTCLTNLDDAIATTNTTLNSCVAATNTCLTNLDDAIATTNTTLNSCVAAINSCSGLNCTGTVKSVNNCSPDTSGNVSVSIPSFTLSGCCLTITME